MSKPPIERQVELRTEAKARLTHAQLAKPAHSTQELLHELQVHQIELEMQKDELQRVQLVIEEMRNRDINLAGAQFTVKLYSTQSCHLCELAEQVLVQAGIAFIKSDVIDDDVLFDRYGMRIPVLQRADNNAELDWPFDAANVTLFLR